MRRAALNILWAALWVVVWLLFAGAVALSIWAMIVGHEYTP